MYNSEVMTGWVQEKKAFGCEREQLQDASMALVWKYNAGRALEVATGLIVTWAVWQAVGGGVIPPEIAFTAAGLVLLETLMRVEQKLMVARGRVEEQRSDLQERIWAETVGVFYDGGDGKVWLHKEAWIREGIVGRSRMPVDAGKN